MVSSIRGGGILRELPLTSTHSYCNSILQCLYHSAPFREQIMRYPTRLSTVQLQSTPNGLPRLRLNTSAVPNGVCSSLSPTRKTDGTSTANSPARKSINAPMSPGVGGIREEKPDSSDYKKKQAMLTGPILTLDQDDSESWGMSSSLLSSLKGIFDSMAAHPSRTGVVSPQHFLETLKRENEMFRTPMHQDAHEFFNLLLNEVMTGVEANSKKPDSNEVGIGLGLSTTMTKSTTNVTTEHSKVEVMAQPESSARWVHELFEGTLTSETKCLTCETTSFRDEAFLDLSVDLEHNSSVTACLRKFSEEEMLCERNKFHCDSCGGLQEAEKRMKIKRLPRILALHLKRFKYTEDQQRLQKLFHRVVYPNHLRLFNTTDDAEDPDKLYELYAVVVHIGGGPYHGHYVSVIKTPDKGWLVFDDELVEPVYKNFVRKFYGDGTGLAVAYVLFYQETTVEAVEREQEAEVMAKTRTADSGGLHHLQSTKTAPATPLTFPSSGLSAGGSSTFSIPEIPPMKGHPNGTPLSLTTTTTNTTDTTNTTSSSPASVTTVLNDSHYPIPIYKPELSLPQNPAAVLVPSVPIDQPSPPPLLSSPAAAAASQQSQRYSPPLQQPQQQSSYQSALQGSLGRATSGYRSMRNKIPNPFSSSKDKQGKDGKNPKDMGKEKEKNKIGKW